MPSSIESRRKDRDGFHPSLQMRMIKIGTISAQCQLLMIELVLQTLVKFRKLGGTGEQAI